MPRLLNGVNADEFASIGFCWRLFGINWDVGEVYSGARGVDVGGKRVIGIGITPSVWDEDWVWTGDDVPVKWSDKWDVPSWGTIDKLFD